MTLQMTASFLSQEQDRPLDGEPCINLRDAVPCGPEGKKAVEPEPPTPAPSTSDKIVSGIETGILYSYLLHLFFDKTCCELNKT